MQRYVKWSQGHLILPKVGYPSGGRIVHVVGGVGYLSRRLGSKVRTAAEKSVRVMTKILERSLLLLLVVLLYTVVILTLKY